MEDAPRSGVVSADDAVAMVTTTLGEPFHVIGPLTGGETGATAIRDASGRKYVMKWEVDGDHRVLRREGVRQAERLRLEARWPVPHHRLVETDTCTIVLQTFVPGATLTTLTHGVVDELLELHERRLDMARERAAHGWADDVIAVLVGGGRGHALHEPLRTFDARTRRVVERIEEVGRSLSRSDFDADDVVHGDLHPGNLLASDGRLTAVVDTDFARVGDAGFDAAMLALSSLAVQAEPGVRRRLFEVGVHELAETRRRAYVACLLLRFLDWPIRKGRTRDVEFWLGHADRLLAL